MERLQKVIAHAGVASRRKAEELIRSGRVKVNGKVINEMGVTVSSKDRVEVDGLPLEREKLVYFLFYKPRGVISSVSDDKGRRVVTDYFVGIEERIYPIGRLDYDTSGLLLLTNDGEFANKLTHPRYEIDKTYIAKLEGNPSRVELQLLSKGVVIDGKKTHPAKVKLQSSDNKSKTSIVEITIHEGRNHQVKKMFEKIGFPVKKLKREKYADLTLEGLQPGKFRSLTRKEVQDLLKDEQN